MITSLLLLKGYRLKGSESGIRLTFGVGLLSKWVNRTAAFGGLPIALLTFPLPLALLFHGQLWLPAFFLGFHRVGIFRIEPLDQHRPAPAHSLFSSPAGVGYQSRTSRFHQIQPENLQEFYPRTDD